MRAEAGLLCLAMSMACSAADEAANDDELPPPGLLEYLADWHDDSGAVLDPELLDEVVQHRADVAAGRAHE